MKRPSKVNILGMVYNISYVDNPAEVDLYRRESLWGQIDYWTRTIRVYAKDRTDEDIIQTLVHEILHGLSDGLKLKLFDNGNHDELDVLALGLADTFTRNGWFK